MESTLDLLFYHFKLIYVWKVCLWGLSLFFQMHVLILSFPYLMQCHSHIKSDLRVKYTVDCSRLAGREAQDAVYVICLYKHVTLYCSVVWPSFLSRSAAARDGQNNDVLSGNEVRFSVHMITLSTASNPNIYRYTHNSYYLTFKPLK